LGGIEIIGIANVMPQSYVLSGKTTLMFININNCLTLPELSRYKN